MKEREHAEARKHGKHESVRQEKARRHGQERRQGDVGKTGEGKGMWVRQGKARGPG